LLEINDVELKVINDPETTVTFDGTGASEELGAVQLHGTWQRDTGVVSLALEAAGIPLTPLLMQRLAVNCPDKALTPFHLEGKAALQAGVDSQPASSQPLTHDVRLRVRDGKVLHPKIPLPLENLTASARCLNGRLTVERLTADSGLARVELHGGSARMPHPDQNFEGVVTVSHLPLTKELAQRLPKPVQDLYDMFSPVGKASVELRAARRDGRWLRHHYTMHPEGMGVCYSGFRYPCDHITGVVEYDYL